MSSATGFVVTAGRVTRPQGSEKQRCDSAGTGEGLVNDIALGHPCEVDRHPLIKACRAGGHGIQQRALPKRGQCAMARFDVGDRIGQRRAFEAESSGGVLAGISGRTLAGSGQRYLPEEVCSRPIGHARRLRERMTALIAGVQVRDTWIFRLPKIVIFLERSRTL